MYIDLSKITPLPPTNIHIPFRPSPPPSLQHTQTHHYHHSLLHTLQLITTQPGSEFTSRAFLADATRPGAVHPSLTPQPDPQSILHRNLPADAACPDSALQNGGQLGNVCLARGYFFFQLLLPPLLGVQLGLSLARLCLAAFIQHL